MNLTLDLDDRAIAQAVIGAHVCTPAVARMVAEALDRVRPDLDAIIMRVATPLIEARVAQVVDALVEARARRMVATGGPLKPVLDEAVRSRVEQLRMGV